MTIDPTIKDTLICETYDLHIDFQSPPYDKSKMSDLDAKIQQFIKHFEAIDTKGAKDLLTEYDRQIKPHIQKYTEYSYFKLLQFEEDKLRKTIASGCASLEQRIIEQFDSKMPDVKMKERMKRNDAFTGAVDRADSSHDLTYVEELLKEGPIDINACRNTFFNCPLIKKILIMKYPESVGLLALLLKNGAKLQKEFLKEIIEYFQKVSLNAEIVELMIQQGFDLNAATEKGQSLLESSLDWILEAHRTRLVFYGAGNSNDRKLFRPGNWDYDPPIRNVVLYGLAEEMDIRESVLQEMQKPKDFPISHFSPAERETFVKRCYEKKQFRDLYEVHTLVQMKYRSEELADPRKEKIEKLMRDVKYEHDKDWKIPPEAAVPFVEHHQNTVPDLEKRINQHNQFIKACLEGDLEAASALLKEGNIDLRALMVPRQYPEDQWLMSKTYPLFHYACLKGDLKLIDFLIKAGANVNAAYYGGVKAREKDDVWMPAIIEAILFTKENRQEVIDRLLKAGADIHLKDHAGFLWASFERGVSMHFNPGSSKINSLEALHSFIQCGLNFNLIQRIFAKIMQNNWSWYEGHADFDLWQKRKHDSPETHAKYDKRMELLTAMIYYGAEDIYNPWGCDSVKEYVNNAFKIRDEVLQEMLKKELGEAEDLQRFSMDVVGVVSGYGAPNEIVQHFTPQQRLDLFQRCQKKAASAQPPPPQE